VVVARKHVDHHGGSGLISAGLPLLRAQASGTDYQSWVWKVLRICTARPKGEVASQ